MTTIHQDVEALSSTEVCNRADITYRQLDYWCRIGLIWPSIAQAQGQGSGRRFSTQDLRRARIAKAAMSACLGPSSIAPSISKMAFTHERWLVLVGDDAYVCAEGELEARLGPGSIVVDLGAV